MNTPTLHPAARLRRSGDGNIALGQMAHTICDEHERITREIDQQHADVWLEALCGLLGGMVEPVRRDDATEQLRDGWRGALATLNRIDEVLRTQLTGDTPDGLRDELEVKLGEPPNPALVTAHAAARRIEELRWAAVRATDAGDDDLPSTGCITCATATSALVEIRDAAVLLGADAIDMMTPESEAAEVVALLRSLAGKRDAMRDDITRARTLIDEAFCSFDRGLVYDVERLCEAYTAADRDWHRAISERDEARAELADLRAMLDTETRRHEETARELDTAHEEVERLRCRLDHANSARHWLEQGIVPGRVTTTAASVMLVNALGWAVDDHELLSECRTEWAASKGDRRTPWRADAVDVARDVLAAMQEQAAIEPDDGWEPGPWWTEDDGDDVVMRDSGDCAAHVSKVREGRYSAATWFAGKHVGEQTFHPTRRAAMRWCEQQAEMADVIAGYTSAPTVGATDAGPDAPALIVEGDAAEGAREACAVPAAPVSTAEQRDGETGVDRPSDDLRGPDTEVER